MVENELGGGGLLLLELEIAVTLGAEVLRGGAAEESAVVGAEARCLASVFFRHFCFVVCLTKPLGELEY